MSHSDDEGYLFYNRENQEALACKNDGDIIFEAKIDLDDFYFDKSNNITGSKESNNLFI
ncbi:MAG: hypothetical protein V8R64_17100 [Thomasclavelia sp.]